MTAQGHIIIVDDDAGVRKSIERLLAASGFATTSFRSAEDFNVSASLANALCIILDIHLPGLSGIELRRRLNLPVPVVFITGDDSAEIRKSALAAGCIAYLKKPFPAKALIEAVRRALGPTGSEVSTAPE